MGGGGSGDAVGGDAGPVEFEAHSGGLGDRHAAFGVELRLGREAAWEGKVFADGRGYAEVRNERFVGCPDQLEMGIGVRPGAEQVHCDACLFARAGQLKAGGQSAEMYADPADVARPLVDPAQA